MGIETCRDVTPSPRICAAGLCFMLEQLPPASSSWRRTTTAPDDPRLWEPSDLDLFPFTPELMFALVETVSPSQAPSLHL